MIWWKANETKYFPCVFHELHKVALQAIAEQINVVATLSPALEKKERVCLRLAESKRCFHVTLFKSIISSLGVGAG